MNEKQKKFLTKGAPQSITKQPTVRLALKRLPDFLRAIFREDSERAFVTGFAEPPDILTGKATAGAWKGAEYGKGGNNLLGAARNCYLCISVFHDAKGEHARRRKELHDKTFAIMVDDVEQKIDRAKLKLPPTFEIQTSPGSWQAWYILDPPCEDAEHVGAVIDALVKQGLAKDADPGMKGVTRYGRLPVGINNKAAYGATAWDVQLRGDWEKGPRYAINELVKAYKLDVVKPAGKLKTQSMAPEGVEQYADAILKALRAEGLSPTAAIGPLHRYELAACPWAAEHTTGKEGASYFAPSENNAWNGGFKCHHGHCSDKRKVGDLITWLEAKGHTLPQPRRFGLEDFLFVGPQNAYLCLPTSEFWREEALDKMLPWPLEKVKKTDKTGQPIEVEMAIKPSKYLARHAAVTQVTWLPGHGKIIENATMDEHCVLDRSGGARIANLYTAPRNFPGDPTGAGPWISHIRMLYPEEAETIIAWFAHRVQRPYEKINWAIVMAGRPGIGKDSIIEPVVFALGGANVREVEPQQFWSDFNEFFQAVMMRVSESHDVGEHSRQSFYNRLKRVEAAPPDVFDINSKHLKKYRIRNVVSVVFTSNHEGGGLYVPEDDRRHFMLWTDVEQGQFTDKLPDYFSLLWSWYYDEGLGHIAAYLRTYDLTKFLPMAKANAPKTASFYRVAIANQMPENEDYREALKALAESEGTQQLLAVTVEQIVNQGRISGILSEDQADLASKGRIVGTIMRDLGYHPILRHPPTADESAKKREQRWAVGRRLVTIFGRINADSRTVRVAAIKLHRELRDRAKLGRRM